ncbi:hypothetical protein HDV05_008156, partial [Chytridiales sp. JEL 0842]
VVANAVAALTEIADRDESFEFYLDVSTANKLLTALNECSEWCQVYILESLLYVTPNDHNDAELLADRILPRLQHANSAIVLTAIRVVLYLTNYIARDDVVDGLYRKLGPPLVTLLHNNPEVQYIALRNTILLLQRKPDFLRNEIKVFFCKYNDPIYVKLAKLEIINHLANFENIDQVLPELREYASEVDVDFVRKSVRAIGKCAIKIDIAAEKCVQLLIELIQTKVNYVAQEAIVVIKDIFRKYPNRYESVISILCENLDSLDEPEAKASMIWIIGQYSDRIENADALLDQFLEGFREELPEVQLSLLTAIVKLFIKRPSAGQDLVPKVLKWATEEVDNPDVRDRGFIYWRLLSTNPVAAKAIVLSETHGINADTDDMPQPILEELLLHISTLASVYHKPPAAFVGNLRHKRVEYSSALVKRKFAHLKERRPDDMPDVPSLQINTGSINPYVSDILRDTADDEAQDYSEESPTLSPGGGYFPTRQDSHPEDLLGLDLSQTDLNMPSKPSGLFDPSKIGPSSTPIKPSLPNPSQQLSQTPLPTQMPMPMPMYQMSQPAVSNLMMPVGMSNPLIPPAVPTTIGNPMVPLPTGNAPINPAAMSSMATALMPTMPVNPRPMPPPIQPSMPMVTPMNSNPYMQTSQMQPTSPISPNTMNPSHLQGADLSEEGYVPPKSTMLKPEPGNGLEILGTCKGLLMIAL